MGESPDRGKEAEQEILTRKSMVFSRSREKP